MAKDCQKEEGAHGNKGRSGKTGNMHGKEILDFEMVQ